MKIGVVPKKPVTGVTTSAIHGMIRLLSPIAKPMTVPSATAIRMLRVVCNRWGRYPKQRSGRLSSLPLLNSRSADWSGQA